MNLQQERIDAHCQLLKLEGLMQGYQSLAAEAVSKEWSFLDYLEQVLAHERDARQVRSRQTLVRMAGLPAIKTLDQYDYDFAVGAPKKQIDELDVLIPLSSGLSSVPVTASTSFGAMCLNPFEFRAIFSRSDERGFDKFTGLNPFEFRAIFSHDAKRHTRGWRWS